MSGKLKDTVVIVVGLTVRAEEADRPLAYRLALETAKRLGEDTRWRVLVVTDVLYLNDPQLSKLPVICIGGPGVNNLSAKLFRQLPAVLTVDNVLVIQMDLESDDRRACLWGMNHDQTVEALDLFMKRYLDPFLDATTDRGPAF